MARQVEAKPVCPEPARRQTRDIRYSDDQGSTRYKQVASPAQYLQRAMHMLQRIEDRDDIEAPRSQVRMGQRAGASVDSPAPEQLRRGGRPVNRDEWSGAAM